MLRGMEMALFLRLSIAALAGVALAAWSHRLLPRTLGMSRQPKPFRRPWMEAAGALLFVWVALRCGSGLPCLATYALALLLLATTAADLWLQLIPDRLTFPGALLAVSLNTLWPSRIASSFGQDGLLLMIGMEDSPAWLGGLILSLWGALLGFIALEAIRRIFGLWARAEVMGMGDAKLLLLIGAFLGPLPTVLALALSFPIGVVLGLIRLWTHEQQHGPFGPALAIAALLSTLHGGALVSAISALEARLTALPPSALLGFAGILSVLLLVLMIRLRRRAAANAEAIEQHYREVEARMQLAEQGDAESE